MKYLWLFLVVTNGVVLIHKCAFILSNHPPISFLRAAPESIAWQVQTNKLEKARTSIRKASITNHVTLTEQTLAEVNLIC